LQTVHLLWHTCWSKCRTTVPQRPCSDSEEGKETDFWNSYPRR